MVIGGLALILTCVGLYGVVAYSVAQRTREIGLRMALGATRRAVVRSVLAQGGRLVLAGVALGIGAAMLAARSLGSLMIGVSAADGWPYAGAAMTLGIVAVVAAYLPARRAAGLDPLHAVNGQGGSP
jgi:ABC-type antimicrobial peptide transport system permease subunit